MACEIIECLNFTVDSSDLGVESGVKVKFETLRSIEQVDHMDMDAHMTNGVRITLMKSILKPLDRCYTIDEHASQPWPIFCMAGCLF